jgi:hypothetical protein
MPEQVRQGDVLLIPIDEAKVPRRLTQDPPAMGSGVVLAFGEATGHAHVVLSDRATRFRDDGGDAYLRVAGQAPVPLVHEEHATILLAPGWYRQATQREHWPDAARPVAD